MTKPRRSFNPKRAVAEHVEPHVLRDLADQVGYGGNPEHKRNPGNFDLTPPVSPRPDKTLCDAIGVVEREKAHNLLRRGIMKGLVSAQWRGDFPQNVWAVTPEGEPVEAQLENREAGTYHGYPMPVADPLAAEILRRWTDK